MSAAPPPSDPLPPDAQAQARRAKRLLVGLIFLLLALNFALLLKALGWLESEPAEPTPSPETSAPTPASFQNARGRKSGRFSMVTMPSVHFRTKSPFFSAY